MTERAAHFFRNVIKFLQLTLENAIIASLLLLGQCFYLFKAAGRGRSNPSCENGFNNYAFI